ncbi:MAG: dipeptidase [Proteobacteria bacterium]|nr:dipeptidase [Pseudomonadota bacterium]
MNTPDRIVADDAAATALLDRITLIDGHNDMPFVIWSDPDARGDVRLWDARKRHPETDTDIPRLRAGRVATQINTAFIPTMIAHPIRTRLEVIDVMLQLEQLYPDVFHPVLKPDDIAAAKKAGKIGQLKAVEGLVGVDRVGHLRLFHAMGIRLVTLCHNETLPFIDSATDKPGATPLSTFGAEIIAEMERLGLVIDMAHVSPAAQHAVMDVAKGPVIISHANARALCSHPRNAPDDVIRRIADKGGIVMPTFVPTFLEQVAYSKLLPVMDGMGKAKEGVDKAEYEAARKAAFAAFTKNGVELLIDHIEHMRNLVGIEGLGIGSDFYGGHNPPGLEDASCFPALFSALMRRGWKTGDLEKIAGDNFLRVWRAVWRDTPAMTA